MSVQIEQKSYEMPRATGSPSHILSPLPTSTESADCGYSSMLWIMEESRSRVPYGTDCQVRRDSPLHPRSRRLYYRARKEHRSHARL